jgi:hypothetical protein
MLLKEDMPNGARRMPRSGWLDREARPNYTRDRQPNRIAIAAPRGADSHVEHSAPQLPLTTPTITTEAR